MRAILTLLAAAILAIAGCAPAEPPPPVPPPQYLPAPLPLPLQYNPPLPGPRAGPSMRYRANKPARQHCTIRTHTTTNKAGVKRTAKYRVCLK